MYNDINWRYLNKLDRGKITNYWFYLNKSKNQVSTPFAVKKSIERNCTKVRKIIKYEHSYILGTLYDYRYFFLI